MYDIYNPASKHVNVMQKYTQFISYFRFKCYFTVKLLLLLLLLLLLRYVTIEVVLTKTTVLITVQGINFCSSQR